MSKAKFKEKQKKLHGDIKISGKDMTKLLSYLCENDNPVITIKSAQ